MITVEHHERKIGESNYNLKKLFILWSNMILNFPFFQGQLQSLYYFKNFNKINQKKIPGFSMIYQKAQMAKTENNVDIILPNYNSSDFIGQTINSILKQTHKIGL